MQDVYDRCCGLIFIRRYRRAPGSEEQNVLGATTKAVLDASLGLAEPCDPHAVESAAVYREPLGRSSQRP